MIGLHFSLGKTCSKPLLGALLAVAFCLPTGAQQQPAPSIGELFASDGNAKLIQPAGAGMAVVAGSELSAGVAPARLKLTRGGQVRLCPHSGLSVNSGRFGLMFAMNAGTIEIDYTLVQRGSDFVITPDFSIQLPGPARYHFAMGTNQQGDTCVKTLPGNSAPLQFSELLTAASYRVGVQDSVLFHGGKLTGKASLAATDACGCPEEGAPPVQTAAAPAPEQPAQTHPSAPEPSPVAVNTNQSSPPLPVPGDRPGQVHVEVDTPFVFSGKDAGVKPYSVAKLNLPTLPNVFFVQETVDPVVLEEKPASVSVREEPPAPTPSPKAPEKKEKKGFFGKLKGFFGGMFHH